MATQIRFYRTVDSRPFPAFHKKRLKENPDLFEPLVRERLEIATFNCVVDYIKALRVRTVPDWRNQWPRL